ncbi:MAG: hypothetical protein EB130_01160 [Actinobacteria bacterium]|nr:hypothetical protein [Actinomycetota bacterium]
MSNAQWGFETRQIHAGQAPDSATGARAVPIYQTTSYEFRDSQHAANLFALAEIGNIYTRIMNPTQGVLEARLASLEGATTTAVGLPGALAVSSGQSAELLAILTLAEAGDHIVSSPSLYGGTFDFGASGRFRNFTEPDPSYHGLAYWPALGKGSYIIKARVQMLRDLGAATTPFNAFLFLQGLETLSLRMERHFANAQKVAEFLAAREEVESVNYAGLPTSRWFDRASRYGRGKGYGSVLAFVIKGGRDAGQKFVEALELHSHVANIGDVRSLVIHPASTTHSQLTEAEQRATGVEPGLVRLSVGLESIDDIIADLDAGFRAAKG